MGVVLMKDDYGWEIPSEKAYSAYESLKEAMGVKKLYNSMEFALGTDDWKELIAEVARDYDEETDDSDELLEYFDFEEILDDLVKKMSTDDLADNLAYICRMNDIQIPELSQNIDDALWKKADNDSPEAGRLTLKRPVEYTSADHPSDHYLIVTRTDGKFDVYTRGDYDLVGVGFKTIEEAKANIDEGRTEEHVVTPEEKLDGDESDGGEADKVSSTKPDPENKQVDYKGFRLKKLETGEWQISAAGDGVGMQIVLTRMPSFEAAVKYLFKNTMAPKPTGTDKKSLLLKEYLEA